MDESERALDDKEGILDSEDVVENKSENSAIESDEDDCEASVVSERKKSAGSRGEVLDSEEEEEREENGIVKTDLDPEQEDIILPSVRSSCIEDPADRGEEADSESDKSSAPKGSKVKAKKKKSKEKKKKSPRKKKKESSEMGKSDSFLQGQTQTRKRKKADPNKRKKIRKLLKEDELQEETLQALREEQERQKRLELHAARNEAENNDKNSAGVSFELLDDEDDVGFSAINYDLAFLDDMDVIEPVPVLDASLDVLSAATSVLGEVKNSVPTTVSETSLPTAAPSVVAKVTPMPAVESTSSPSLEVTSLAQMLASETPIEGTQHASLPTPGAIMFSEGSDFNHRATDPQKCATLPSSGQSLHTLVVDALASASGQAFYPGIVQTLAPPSGQTSFPSTVPSLAPLTGQISFPPTNSLLPSSAADSMALSSGQASGLGAAVQFSTAQFNAATTSAALYNSFASIPGLQSVANNLASFKQPQPTMRKPAAAQSSDVICISSESSDDEQTKKLQQQEKPWFQPLAPKPAADTICISSGSDSSSDDVIFAGTDDHEVDEELLDVNNSGMHVDDSMNRPEPDGRVLVNKNRPPDEPEIYLAPRLARAVKPHQIGGIRFMFDNIVESLEIYKKSKGFGCILAHSMGLGKTLQVISFIDVFLNHTAARTALCVVPVNTLLNWVSEFEKWLPGFEGASLHQESGPQTKLRNFKVSLLSDSYKTPEARVRVISSWQREGGVLLMGYEMFRLLTNQKAKKRKKRKTKNAPLGGVIETIDLDEEDKIAELSSEIFLGLVNPGPDLIVCDEGHRIKNSHASISQALKQIETRRRIVLTGYPLQNNLMEYWCMVDFIRPNFLGTKQEFSNMFERPICNGQCADSTDRDIMFMKSRSYVLHSLLKGFVQRRSHLVLKNSLPPKEEYVLLVRLSPWQKKLYNNFIKIHREQASGSFCSSLNPIKAFSICCKIWNHPDVLYRAVKKTLEDQQINDGILDADLDLPEVAIENFLKKAKRKREAMDKGEPVPGSDGKLVQSVGFSPFGEEKEKGINYEWAMNLLRDYSANKLEFSGKMLILTKIIEHSVSQGDKILVFSQSLTTLTLMEEFFAEIDVPNPPNAPQLKRKWRRNESYFRLDGNTSIAEREKMIEQFNDKNNNALHLFLLSTRAGCLGINLVGANRVVVFDISWNPCHDAQAVCRVYRYGQKKRCVIYRLICDQSMEKKIYDRQISKQGMADRVVDELNPIQSLERQDITKLLIYDDEDLPSPGFTECEKVCNDDSLLEACRMYSHWLTKIPFHHESLLMDCKGSRLTKAEKRAAQKGYEQEKRASVSCNYNRPSYANFYAAAGYPQKTATDQKRSIFPTSNTTAPSDRPVANVRPIQSTPQPMQIGGRDPSMGPQSFDNQMITLLQQSGINVRKTIAATDIPLPRASAGPNSKPLVSAGDSFYMIHGSKGLYIGTTTGRIFALRSQKVNEGGETSPLVPGPGGQMVTPRERESQIIKSAFNTMIRRNPAFRQPMRNQYMPRQPIANNYPQLGNYGQLQKQDYGSLVSLMTQQNPMMNQQIPLLNQQNLMTQQNSMMQQQPMITQQNSMMMQQNPMMTQQNSMMTQQNLMMPQQNSMMVPTNQVDQNFIAQQILAMTQQNPMMLQQLQNSNFVTQQTPSMTQNNNMPIQQSFSMTSPHIQSNGFGGNNTTTQQPQPVAMGTTSDVSSLTTQNIATPSAKSSQEQSLAMQPHEVLPSQTIQTPSTYALSSGHNFASSSWPMLQNAEFFHNPASVMQQINNLTQHAALQSDSALIDAIIAQQTSQSLTSQGSSDLPPQQNFLTSQHAGDMTQLTTDKPHLTAGMTRQNSVPAQLNSAVENPNAVLQNLTDNSLPFQGGIMSQQNNTTSQQNHMLTPQNDLLSQQLVTLAGNFPQMQELVQGAQSPN